VQLWLRRKIRDCADAADQSNEELRMPEGTETLVHYEREIREKRTMSHTRIVVTEEAGVFRLRTERGFVLGPRLYSVAPEAGKVLPGLKDEFTEKLPATRAAMDWNVYLLWAWKKRSKSRERSAD
jgi:hypothetical protein